MDRPVEAFTTPPQPSAPTGPGTAGHPGHFPGQAVIADVTIAGGSLVAVGFSGVVSDSPMAIPDWQAVAWRSSDGRGWDFGEIADGPGAFAVAVAPTGPTGMVAGGRMLGAAMAWTSEDASRWNSHVLPSIDPDDTWERVTAITTGHGMIVAGGSAGPELFERSARFWTSVDGASWTAVPDQPAFQGAEVTDVMALATGWLALGRIGTGQETTGSVAWLSDDGAKWGRIDDSDLRLGWARSVAMAADGRLVAVGSATDERGARAWTSGDQGQTWSLSPETDAMTWYGKKIRMMDVTASGWGFLAVGNLVGVQFGTGMSWVSSDGIAWRRSPLQPPMGQAELEAVVRDGDRYVAVGTFGAPDNYIPRVWISPPS